MRAVALLVHCAVLPAAEVRRGRVHGQLPEHHRRRLQDSDNSARREDGEAADRECRLEHACLDVHTSLTDVRLAAVGHCGPGEVRRSKRWLLHQRPVRHHHVRRHFQNHLQERSQLAPYV